MCPNFESMRDKWTCAGENADEKIVAQYNLVARMDGIREDHVKFISELARYNNEVPEICNSNERILCVSPGTKLFHVPFWGTAA